GCGGARGNGSEQDQGQGLPPQMLGRDCPPSTGMQAPLRRLACPEQTNTTALATSATDPNRPNGISRRTNSAMPSGSCCCRRCHPPPSQRIEPGAMQFTVTPLDATSRASERTKLISAAFAAL